MRRSILVVGLVTATLAAAGVGLLRHAADDAATPSRSLLGGMNLPTVAAATGGNTIAGCQILPSDNVWNTPVDSLPVDKNSSTWLGSIGLATKLHPDFGHDRLNGIPLTIIPPNTRHVKMQYDYREDSDLANYPIPPDALVEADGAPNTDAHILLLDPRRCLLFELYNAHPNPDGSWHVGSAAQFDLTSNALREDRKTSADAAGLPILPGLVRYDEVAGGEIHHAIRFTIPKTQKAHIWPARHDASHNTDPSLPPMGMRMRLKAGVDISGFPAQDQVILRALKRYGAILADNGSAIFLSGIPDKRWNDLELHELGKITARDFEVVDESDWQMLTSSARVDPEVLQAQRHK